MTLLLSVSRSYEGEFFVSTALKRADCLFNVPPTTEIYTLSLHDALPISRSFAPSTIRRPPRRRDAVTEFGRTAYRSEEHTSELQSRSDLVCRLLLEKKKQTELGRGRYFPRKNGRAHV